MIKVKDIEGVSEQVIQFLDQLKIKQKEKQKEGFIFYPKISLYMALKNKIFFTNLLLHPLVLISKKFFESKAQLKTSVELQVELGKILEYEATSLKETLTKSEFKEVVNCFEKLKKKNNSK